MIAETPLRADQCYAASEAAKVLGISRATFYRLAWFKGKKVKLSIKRVGYLASDIALYQSLQRGAE